VVKNHIAKKVYQVCLVHRMCGLNKKCTWYMAGVKRLPQLRVDLSAISSYCGFFGWYILSFINGVRVCVFDLFLIAMI